MCRQLLSVAFAGILLTACTTSTIEEISLTDQATAKTSGEEQLVNLFKTFGFGAVVLK